mmetsp:Transcript_76606/g.155535  ORF Transcript_76606/g.155535 Transcript_76606/m.155535 type:complete len:214 (+) Transcript_76606:625-1266(+)
MEILGEVGRGQGMKRRPATTPLPQVPTPVPPVPALLRRTRRRRKRIPRRSHRQRRSHRLSRPSRPPRPARPRKIQRRNEAPVTGPTERTERTERTRRMGRTERGTDELTWRLRRPRRPRRPLRPQPRQAQVLSLSTSPRPGIRERTGRSSLTHRVGNGGYTTQTQVNIFSKIAPVSMVGASMILTWVFGGTMTKLNAGSLIPKLLSEQKRRDL